MTRKRALQIGLTGAAILLTSLVAEIEWADRSGMWGTFGWFDALLRWLYEGHKGLLIGGFTVLGAVYAWATAPRGQD